MPWESICPFMTVRVLRIRGPPLALDTSRKANGPFNLTLRLGE